MSLIDDWQVHATNVGKCAYAIFETANVKITERGFADPTFLALTLMARTVSNLKGAVLLLDERRIVEARTITRCCLENLYWCVALAEQGVEFVKQMRDDELKHRKTAGQALFEADIKLDDEVEGRLRAYLRSISGFAGKTLSPKAVASIRGDYKDSYIFYAQLSSDAAHPSATALNRYVVSEHADGPGFNTEPPVHPEEIVETYEYLSMACLGVCVAVNQIIGGTQGGGQLNALADRHSELSKASAAARESKQDRGSAQ
jgi:hypothetical protein